MSNRFNRGPEAEALRRAILDHQPRTSFREVAESVGLSYYALYNMANGRTPVRNEVLDAVRRYLNLPDSWPRRLTEGDADALSSVQETYMIVYRNADRLPLIQPGDSLEIQPAALPRIGALNLVRSGTQDVLAEIEVQAGELRADREVDLSTAAPVGYVVAVFSEDGLAYTSEKGVAIGEFTNAVRRRS